MPTMDSYPAQTTPNDSDYHIVNDGVSGETKKITREDYLGGAPLPADTVTTAAITDANVTTAKIADSAVTSAKVAAGMPVQIVSSSTSAVATGTTLTVLDDTIPQNTEGDEYMTLAITPKSATNVLVISVVACLANTAAASNMIGAFFQDTTANALAANTQISQANQSLIFTLTHTMTAGTTSATTFKFRAGCTAAGTTTFNGRAGARLFGAIPKSSIVITEYKA